MKSADVAPGVAIVTLGCKVNQVEADAIAGEIATAGLPVVAREEAAIVVIVTCTVTGEADRKARKAVHQALALPRSPRVVLTGCMVSVEGASVPSFGARVIVEPDKARVAACVVRLARGSVSEEGGPTVASAVSAGEDGPDPARIAPPVRSRTRAQVKVEDGCDAFCAYCIVPYARGLPRSVPAGQVVTGVRAVVEAGVAEVVLTGINIGHYASDGLDLAGLIAAVASTGVRRIRVSSIEPDHVDARLLDVAASTPAFCRHLHIPLQSGSDGVLRRMGRPYTTARYREVLEDVRSALPGVSIGADVIAGFPGETDAEWAETLAFVESAALSRLHVFRYSVRQGTRAATMPGHVPAKVRGARAAELRELGSRLAMQDALGRVGSVVEVLVERTDVTPAGMVAEGVSREYNRVVLRDEAFEQGALVMARVTSVDTEGRLVVSPIASA